MILKDYIPCTCRNCGAEFTYLHGFSMRECSAECYAATHPKCTYDPETHRMQGVKPTEEEFKDMVKYLVTMHYVFKMLEEELISLEEYYIISFKHNHWGFCTYEHQSPVRNPSLVVHLRFR